ncbi:MAG: PEP-CTERM sorting domain-containing protein [Planctomycetota bacterium]
MIRAAFGFAVLLLASTLELSAATVLFQDQFNDETGVDPPAGWVNVPSTAASPTFIESGGVATMSRNQNATTAGYFANGSAGFDAQTGAALSFELVLNGISADGVSPAAQIIGDGAAGDDFFSMAVFGDGRVQMSAIAGGVGQNALLTTLPSYAGGQISITATLFADTFTIETDVDNFSSGELAYSISSPGFSRTTLGSTAGVRLLTGGTAGSAEFDSVTVTAVPEPSSIVLLTAFAGLCFLRIRSRARKADQSGAAFGHPG